MMREVVIRAGEVAIRARLLDTPTAERIWAALPIYSAAKTWGGEIYFDGKLVRKDGLFVAPELMGLNPDRLIG